MCTTIVFQHKVCHHYWAVISEPCGPGMGFLTCNTFERPDMVKEPPKLYKTRTRPCPRCARDAGRMDHRYFNPHEIRLVESMGGGIKGGPGSTREDWGCEVKCKDGCVIL